MAILDGDAVARRHSPVVRSVDRFAPLSVGNGRFAFTVDATGLQTLADYYGERSGAGRYRGIPLGTQSEWGWHTAPNPRGYSIETFPLTRIETHGRPIDYLVGDRERDPSARWLYGNPHRLQLGWLKFDFGDGPVSAETIESVDQILDLGEGVIRSRFAYRGLPVSVCTCCHPDLDLVAVRIESPWLGRKGRLGVALEFPSCCGEGATRAEFGPDPGAGRFTRTLGPEPTVYQVAVRASASLGWTETGRAFILRPAEPVEALEVVFLFAPGLSAPEWPAFAATRAASRAHWRAFWRDGGAMDFSACADPRAPELERRVVLSQYLTAIQCAGSLPPQETGLVFNSWHGRFHLEMHWWHAVHFALWGRLPLLERSLGFYRAAALREGRRTAGRQGYPGVRWPKCVGPDAVMRPTGFEAVLVWQQPHPIYYAELCYRIHRDRRTLDAYREIVFETAAFMAAYAAWNEAEQRYWLGPPIMPAQEIHEFRSCFNPTFELAYWAWGLDTALKWKQRLGLPPEPLWARVRDRLSDLPARDGVYLAAESAPDTYTDPRFRTDHPSMLGALGMLPETRRTDRNVMRRTLHKVLETWSWDTAWGWDYGLAAMTAARVGEPGLAVDILLRDDERNTFFANGHNYVTPGLPIYLPGNGALLTAVAMMAAGWDGAPAGRAPGFPADGSWRLHWRGLHPMP